MSIPLVQENTKDAINTSIIAIKRNVERINTLLGLVDNDSPDLSGFATKQELQDAVTQVETDLAPVDEVTVDNMHSVTSNAVADALSKLILVSKSSQMLDYNKVLTSSGLTYTMPFNGVIYINFIKMYLFNTLFISRNGVEVARAPIYFKNNDGSANFLSIQCFAKQGDIIKISVDGNPDRFGIQAVVAQELEFSY